MGNASTKEAVAVAREQCPSASATDPGTPPSTPMRVWEDELAAGLRSRDSGPEDRGCSGSHQPSAPGVAMLPAARMGQELLHQLWHKGTAVAGGTKLELELDDEWTPPLWI